METLKMIAQQFMDPELLIIIGGIIVALILLRVFSNFLSRHKILKIAVVGVVILSLVLGIIWFINNRKDLYSDNTKTFVIGEVKNISSAVRKVELKVITSNVKYKHTNLLNDRLVVVNIGANCKFIDNNGKEIDFDDISFYDTVQIYVKENNIDDTQKENLNGVKVVLKNQYKK